MKLITDVLNEQYEALTEDLDKAERQTPFSRANVIETIIANERRHLVDMYIREDSMAKADFATFVTVAMPLVRKVMSRLIAMDLVSVQPISQPEAKIFYLDFVWGATYDTVTKGESIYAAKPLAYATRATEGSTPKDIQMKLTSTSISAIEKALKASWSIESEQDLRAYHNLSIEGEIMSVLQEQITREIDGQILGALYAGATAGNVNWDTTIPVGDTTTLYANAYKRTIFEALEEASNMIYKKRYRPGTWIVGHPDDILRLEKLESFHSVYSIQGIGGNPDQAQIGRTLVGTLGSRWQVYKDPFWPHPGVMLMGYKGGSWSDTVGYYAPYIPLYTTPMIIDPNDFTPRRGIMSRYAYGSLIGDGLATITLQNIS